MQEILDLAYKTADSSASVLLVIFITLFVTGFLEEMGVLNGVSALARPLTRLAHLPPISAAAFIVALGSAVSANTMIAKMKVDTNLSDKEVLLCALMNSIPVYFRELFTYQIAFVIPALGLLAGEGYALISISTALIKLMIVLIVGRLFLPERTAYALDESPRENVPLGTAAKRAVVGQSRIFIKMAVTYIAMTFVFFALDERGAFKVLSALPLAKMLSIPAQCLVPVTVYMASPRMGISLLGPMIRNGSITEVQALIVLMMGSMAMLPIYAARSMVPNYSAVFGMRLGISLVTISTGTDVLVRLMFLLILLRIS